MRATDEMRFTCLSMTILSAKSSSVQWSLPSGGSVQASAMRCFSALSSNFLGWPERGRSKRARARPCVTKRFRTFSTVRAVTRKTAAMATSVLPASLRSSMLARRMTGALLAPLLVVSCNCRRSRCESVTVCFCWYLFIPNSIPLRSCIEKTKLVRY